MGKPEAGECFEDAIGPKDQNQGETEDINGQPKPNGNFLIRHFY